MGIAIRLAVAIGIHAILGIGISGLFAFLNPVAFLLDYLARVPVRSMFLCSTMHTLAGCISRLPRQSIRFL